LNFTFWVKPQREKMHANYPIIHKNYFPQAFEVHNLGLSLYRVRQHKFIQFFVSTTPPAPELNTPCPGLMPGTSRINATAIQPVSVKMAYTYLKPQIMQLGNLPKMQGGGHADILYGISTGRQNSRFGKILSLLRLQMPEMQPFIDCPSCGSHIVITIYQNMRGLK